MKTFYYKNMTFPVYRLKLGRVKGMNGRKSVYYLWLRWGQHYWCWQT